MKDESFQSIHGVLQMPKKVYSSITFVKQPILASMTVLRMLRCVETLFFSSSLAIQRFEAKDVGGSQN
jgi:hypothetical protein